MNILKRILQVILHPIDAIKVSQGYCNFCDTCDKIMRYGWLGSVDSVTKKTTRMCMECCDKEGTDKIFKFENKDEIDQTIEHNAYDKDGNKLGGVVISYLTDEQVNEIKKLRQEINEDRQKQISTS